MSRIYDVGIIGGGISGVVSALQFSENGASTVLFEQKNSVVNGPPFCHLHAGGNLYPDISIDQCKLLMKQSIEMARLFPQSIDERPTFISIPKTEKYEPKTIEQRLKGLVKYYKELIETDLANEILGMPDDYYKVYSAKDLKHFAQQPKVADPKTTDDWLINAIKLIDFEKLKTPVFMVQEYGWNLFRLAAQAQLALQNSENCNLQLNTLVTEIKDVREQKLNYNWEITANNQIYKVKYLINSSGFKTGEIDESLQVNSERLIEFKAAYVSKWENSNGLIPELIFHGERGTPNGMAQLTPYSNNYFQIHGMTNDITLFEGGLIKNKGNGYQPLFNQDIIKYLDKGWESDEVNVRTQNAINFVSRFLPEFSSATVAGPPLFGAQQIIGSDVNLRVGEVSFPSKFYARSEIIKASSALTVAQKIAQNIKAEGLLSAPDKQPENFNLLNSVYKNSIDKLAREIALERGFPESLAKLLVERS